MFALKKFRSYLLSVKVIAFSDRAALKALLQKNDSKCRLIRSVFGQPFLPLTPRHPSNDVLSKIGKPIKHNLYYYLA